MGEGAALQEESQGDRNRECGLTRRSVVMVVLEEEVDRRIGRRSSVGTCREWGMTDRSVVRAGGGLASGGLLEGTRSPVDMDE